LIDPAKWRIVGARADAWIIALVDTGLAEVERNADVHWVPPTPIVSRVERVMPRVSGGLPLIVARTARETVEDAGVAIAVGEPAVIVTGIPDCGCDACDSGSQDVLDELDEYMFSVVSGAFRRLWSGSREITVIGHDRSQASGHFKRGEINPIVIDPTGWRERSGTPWTADG
jgi:hypothetical protein